MLPPEKEDGNIEYKRYIMIKFNNEDDINTLHCIPLLKKKVNGNNDSSITISDIEEYEKNLELKKSRSNLRFNQLATQMRYRINEGNGIAIYYIGVNDNGSFYKLSDKERSESLKNLKNLSSYISCKIDKLITTNEYMKVIIKRIGVTNSVSRIEKNILFLGDSESGKTTFLSYLVKNKLDTKNCKARLHILNHKHEIESGKTSSFTYQYVNFNDTNLVLIDSPGFDGTSSKSIRKRCKLILSLSIDLVVFFDKPNEEWYRKEFYKKYFNYRNVPSIDVNLFEKSNFINLVEPISQESIYSFFSMNFKNSITELIPNKINNRYANYGSLNNFSDDSSIDKNGILNTSRFKSKLENNQYKSRLIFNMFNKSPIRFGREFNDEICDITFLSSYPHQDMGLILSGFLNKGNLFIGKKLYCYIDYFNSTKFNIFNEAESIHNVNDLSSNEFGQSNNSSSEISFESIYCNPIKIEVKSIHKNGYGVEKIVAPSFITISVDYSIEYENKLLNNYDNLSNLLKFKDLQINFLSNFSYKPLTIFKLKWEYYSGDIEDINKLKNIEILVRNQVINLVRIENDESNLEYNEIEDEDTHIVSGLYVSINLKNYSLRVSEKSLCDSSPSNEYSKPLFNIKNSDFIYDNLENFGFGTIK